jgi:allantoinase
MLRIGAVAKCAPPLRAASDRKWLTRSVLRGDVDIVASDHSPAPLEMKQDANFFRVWGGIAGVQNTLGVLLDIAAPERVAELTAANPARRFGLAKKGRLEVGFDADFALVDIEAEYNVTRESLLQRHGLSPYIGATLRGVVRRTILRGETIFGDGRIFGSPRGKMIRHAAAGIHA